MERPLIRIAIYSLCINLVLVAVKLTLAAISGSLALRADGLHSLVDAFASVAVLAGLIISGRKAKAFPYGLYKVENMVAVVIALLLFVAGYEIAREAVVWGEQEIISSPWLLGAVAGLALVPLLFGSYEISRGRRANSPSLMAEGRQFQADALSSVVVFFALLGHHLGLPLDRVGAGLIVLLIFRVGWGLLADSTRVLLDASLDAETLDSIRRTILAQPAVTEVKSITGRNSGRYRFVEAEVAVRLTDLERAHELSLSIEEKIRATTPRVERVLIHYEPWPKAEIRYAVPLADSQGTVSHHFGLAPYFALITAKATTREILKQEILSNPHHAQEERRGIRVAEFLLGQKVDVVLAHEDMTGKGPGYALADAGVEIMQTNAHTLTDALRELEQGG